MFPALLAAGGFGSTARLLNLVSSWAAHDPNEPHWHLGPVGIDLDWQGKGVGSALLRKFRARMDVGHAMAYLETDQRENVGFYERFGFHVTAEDQVLGLRNWFMARGTKS